MQFNRARIRRIRARIRRKRDAARGTHAGIRLARARVRPNDSRIRRIRLRTRCAHVPILGAVARIPVLDRRTSFFCWPILSISFGFQKIRRPVTAKRWVLPV
jgi:hypothetical protein